MTRSGLSKPNLFASEYPKNPFGLSFGLNSKLHPLYEAIIAAADKNVWILGVVLDAHDRRGGGELELGVVGVLSQILKSQCPSIYTQYSRCHHDGGL